MTKLSLLYNYIIFTIISAMPASAWAFMDKINDLQRKMQNMKLSIESSNYWTMALYLGGAIVAFLLLLILIFFFVIIFRR